MEHVNGIDVYEGNWYVDGKYLGINWPLVKATGYSFAYIKVSEGVGVDQYMSKTQMQAARAAGLLVGAYHFMSWHSDPTAQARYFLSQYLPARGDLPPALDCEGPVYWQAAGIIDRIAAWKNVVEPAAYGKRCVMYMGPRWWEDNMGGSTAFAGHPRWLPQYSVEAPGDGFPRTTHWPPTIWQYDDRGAIEGCPTPVDRNWFLGTPEDLKALCL